MHINVTLVKYKMHINVHIILLTIIKLCDEKNWTSVIVGDFP